MLYFPKTNKFNAIKYLNSIEKPNLLYLSFTYEEIYEICMLLKNLYF